MEVLSQLSYVPISHVPVIRKEAILSKTLKKTSPTGKDRVAKRNAT